MERLVLLLWVMCLLSGCEVDAIVDSEHESVLQINAIIFSGEPLPLIEVKQSFNAPGQQILLLDSSQVFVSGAQIDLRLNSQLVEVREISAGLYQPLTDDIVNGGDIIDINVRKDNRYASAQAVVPEIDENMLELKLLSDTVFLTVNYMIDYDYEADEPFYYITDTSYFGYASYQLTINQIPNYLAGRLKGNFDSLLSTETFYGQFDENYRIPEWDVGYYGDSHEIFRKDELVNIEEVFMNEYSFLIFEEGDYDDIPKTGQFVEVSYDLLIPEDIYIDYVDIENNVWAPLTITNVTGGVGLFIGCARLSGIRTDEVVISKFEFQLTPEEALDRYSY